MSLILEALKKSEQQRRLGEAPTFGSPVVTTRRRRSALPILAILIVIAAAGGWWLMRRSPAPSAAPTSADATRAAADKPISRDVTAAPAANRTPDRAKQNGPGAAALSKNVQDKRPPTPANANVARGTPSAPAAVAMPPTKPVGAPPITPTADTPAGLRTTAPPPTAATPPMPAAQDPDAIKPGATPANAPNATPPAPAAPKSDAIKPGAAPNAAPATASAPTKPQAAGAALPTIWELPFATRKDIPALDLSMHVYSADPKQRFVVLKGDRHVEGDEIATDLTLREIRQDGLVLEFKGQRFFFPRTGR